MIRKGATSLKTTKTRPWPWLRRCGAGVASTAAALAALWIAAGCDSSTFVPPPPPGGARPRGSTVAATYDVKGPAVESAAAAGKPQPGRPGGAARAVELILAGPARDDRAYLVQALRRELGDALIHFRVAEPDSPERSSPAGLVAAIKSAVDRGVAGLIVEPLDDPVVVDALYDAIRRGSSVLLLDRPVPARQGRTIPRVEYTGLADAGRQIVEDIVDANRKLKRAHPGRAVVLHHRSSDAYADRCLASLLEPLRARGQKLEVVSFEGDPNRAIAALRKSLDADPAVDMVLADDSYGMIAAMNLRTEWTKPGRPEFLIAGYSPYDSRNPDVLNRARSFADRSVEAYTLKTFQAMRGLLDGKPVGDVVGVPVTVHRQPTLFVPAAEKPAAPEKKAGSP
jgi:ABC-type sugar transport system substrate-binding protein